MKINTCNISKVISSIAMIMLIMAALAGYLGHTFLLDLSIDRDRQLARTRDAEWYFIESVLYENYDKAYSSASSIKSELISGIDVTYGDDRARLKEDLTTLNYSSPIFKLFSMAVIDKYSNNIPNDRNDPFIMSSKGMYTDLSLNRAVKLTGQIGIRDWESEYSLHSNPALMRQTILNLVERTGKPVFWEYTQSSNPNHIVLAHMDIHELRRVFDAEGVDGLSTYEFGKAVYIFEHEDLFGVPDVNNSSTYTKNDKIIIVAGFSLHDALLSRYSSTIAKYSEMTNTIELRYSYTKQAITNSITTIVSLFLISFLVLAYIQNLVVLKNVSEKAGGEDANRNIP